MKVAVVILNWNGLDLLKKFLPGVITNSEGRATIFVADNGSSDGSVEWLIENHPGVELIRNGENLGFAEGYNRALEYIDAEYFVLLNSDVEVSNGWLDPAIQLLENNKDVAACQPKILSFNNKDYFEYAGAAGGFIDKYGYPFCRGRILNNTEKDCGQYDNVEEIFWSSGACFFIRSSVWKETGGFDASFFAHMEEIDLCWRIHSLDYKILFVPESIVYHVGGGTLPYNSPSKLFYNFRNNLYLLHKNLPDNKLWSILFRRKLLDGVASIRFLTMFNFSAVKQVWKSHIAYRKNIQQLNKFRETKSSGINTYPEKLILNKSLVISYYIMGKKKFDKIWPSYRSHTDDTAS